MAIQRISSDQISDGTVIAADIADGSVTGPKIGLTAINANNIVDGSITGPKLGAGALSSNNISAGSITGDKLGLTAINANNIVNGGVTVAKGGTGLSTLTANSVVLGNGTDPVQLIAPGTSGNVLTSNGTNWTSQAAAAGGGDYIMQVFTTPGTWTKPAGLKAVKVTVVGGGGAATTTPPGPGFPGGTSSFGSPAFLSATGGTAGVGNTPATPSTGAGGSGSGGQLNITGQSGTYVTNSSGDNLFSGGGTGFGLGLSTPYNTSVAGIGYGGGGGRSDAIPSGIFGAGGGGGGASVEYIDAPALPGPQPYTVGAGGVAPAPGRSGATGVIIVEEFY